MNADYIPRDVQRQVRDRAGNRCEYCALSQLGQEATFHIDHVVPHRDGGQTVVENLALACVSCSLRKGARTAAIDPDTATLTPLFNPRIHAWADHFRVAAGCVIVGLTSVGRASVDALSMNRPLAIEIRREEALRGRYPSET